MSVILNRIRTHLQKSMHLASQAYETQEANPTVSNSRAWKLSVNHAQKAKHLWDTAKLSNTFADHTWTRAEQRILNHGYPVLVVTPGPPEFEPNPRIYDPLEELHDLRRDIHSLKIHYDLLDQEHRQCMSQIEVTRRKEHCEELRRQTKRMQEDVARITCSYEELQDEYALAQRQITKLKTKLAIISDHENDCDRDRDNNNRASDDIDRLSFENDRLSSQIRAYQSMLTQLCDRLTDEQKQEMSGLLDF